MAKTKSKKITWKSIKVKADSIDPTPGNYKISTELGRERMLTSLGKFGRAGTVVVNYSKKKGRYDLIDGNSRWKEQMNVDPKELMEVSIPSRPLTPQEYKEMSAIFDFAKAGEVDLERIKQDLGTSANFFEKWNLEVPMDLLNNLGANAPRLKQEVNSNNQGQPLEAPSKDITLVVSLIMSEVEKETFDKLIVKLGKKFKSEDLTTIVFKALKSIK